MHVTKVWLVHIDQPDMVTSTLSPSSTSICRKRRLVIRLYTFPCPLRSSSMRPFSVPTNRFTPKHKQELGKQNDTQKDRNRGVLPNKVSWFVGMEKAVHSYPRALHIGSLSWSVSCICGSPVCHYVAWCWSDWRWQQRFFWLRWVWPAPVLTAH